MTESELNFKLAEAIVAKDSACVISWLRAGANVNSNKDLVNGYPITLAVRSSSLDVLKALLTQHELDKGGISPVPNLHVLGRDGMSPLMLAVYAGDFDKVSALLEAGAFVDQLMLSEPEFEDAKYCNMNGATALIFASLHGYVDIAKLLLLNGADPLVCSDAGMTAHLATNDTAMKELLELNIVGQVLFDISKLIAPDKYTVNLYQEGMPNHIVRLKTALANLADPSRDDLYKMRDDVKGIISETNGWSLSFFTRSSATAEIYREIDKMLKTIEDFVTPVSAASLAAAPAPSI